MEFGRNGDENSDDYYYYYYYGDYEDDDNSNTGIGGVTALHIAVGKQNLKFVEKLLTVPGIIVDSKKEGGRTPLFDATFHGYVKIMTMLHAAGADIHAKDDSGSMPIHVAAGSGELQALKTLVDLGEDLNVIDGYGKETPLIIAVKSRNHDVATYLVQMGANILVRDSDNMTALDYAMQFEDIEMEQILNSTDANQECQIYGTKYHYSFISDLGLAALDNDFGAVDDLIKKVSSFKIIHTAFQFLIYKDGINKTHAR